MYIKRDYNVLRAEANIVKRYIITVIFDVFESFFKSVRDITNFESVIER